MPPPLVPAWRGAGDSPVRGRILASPVGIGEEPLDLLGGAVAAGQEDEARTIPAGCGSSEPWGGGVAAGSPSTSPPGTPQPYLAGAFTTWSSAGSPRRRLSAGSSAARLRSPGCAGERRSQCLLSTTPQPDPPPQPDPLSHPTLTQDGQAGGFAQRQQGSWRGDTWSGCGPPLSPLPGPPFSPPVPSRCTTEASSSPSASSGPSGRPNLRGMEWVRCTGGIPPGGGTPLSPLRRDPPWPPTSHPTLRVPTAPRPYACPQI